MTAVFKGETAISDLSREKLFAVAGMSAGTILKWNCLHPDCALSAFPANNGIITNLAAERAAAIMSVGDPRTLDMSFLTDRESASTLLRELTGKGALRIIPTQEAATNTSNYGYITPPTAIAQYLLDHIGVDDALMISVMTYYERANLSTTPNPQQPLSFFANTTGPTSNYLWSMYGGTPSIASALLTVPAVSGGAIVGEFTLHVALVNTWNGTKPTNLSGLYRALAGFGTFGAVAGNNLNKAAGGRIYDVQADLLSFAKRTNGGLGGTLAEEGAAAMRHIKRAWWSLFGPSGPLNTDTVTTPIIA